MSPFSLCNFGSSINTSLVIQGQRREISEWVHKIFLPTPKLRRKVNELFGVNMAYCTISVSDFGSSVAPSGQQFAASQSPCPTQIKFSILLRAAISLDVRQMRFGVSMAYQPEFGREPRAYHRSSHHRK
jgi:hypothetical protein